MPEKHKHQVFSKFVRTTYLRTCDVVFLPFSIDWLHWIQKCSSKKYICKNIYIQNVEHRVKKKTKSHPCMYVFLFHCNARRILLNRFGRAWPTTGTQFVRRRSGMRCVGMKICRGCDSEWNKCSFYCTQCLYIYQCNHGVQSHCNAPRQLCMLGWWELWKRERESRIYCVSACDIGQNEN